MEVTTKYATTLKVLRIDNNLEFTPKKMEYFIRPHALTPPKKMG